MTVCQAIRSSIAKTALPCILLFVSGCGGGGTGGDTPPITSSASGTLQPNVVPLPADGTVTLSNVTPASIMLSGKVPPLKVGEVIAGGPAPGIMRKVVGVSQSVSSATVQTTDATLSDVFQQANIDFSGTATPGTAIGPLPTGLTFDEPLRGNGPSKSFKFSNVTISPGSGSAGVTLNGTASITLALNCNIQITSGSNGNSAKFVPTITGALNVTASANTTVILPSVQIHLFTLPFEPVFVGNVAGVPLWVTLQIDFYSTASGQVTAGVSVTSSANISVGEGVQYQNGQWSPVSTYSQNFKVVPNYTASVNATCYVTPINIRCSAIFDGVAGPFANVDAPKFVFGLHSLSDPLTPQTPQTHFTVDGDFDGIVGLSVDFLGFKKSYSASFDQNYHLYPSNKADYFTFEPTYFEALGVATNEDGARDGDWGWSYGQGTNMDEGSPQFTYFVDYGWPVNLHPVAFVSGGIYTLTLVEANSSIKDSPLNGPIGTPGLPATIQLKGTSNPDGSISLQIINNPFASWMTAQNPVTLSEY